MSTTPASIGDTVPVTETAGAKEEHAKVTSSYTIFLIVVSIVFLAIAIVFGVNTYFYDKIRKTGCGSITASDAEALYWTNLVLAVIAGIMFIVSIILIFTETKAPTYANEYLGKLRAEGERGVRGAYGYAAPRVKAGAARLGTAARSAGARAYQAGARTAQGAQLAAQRTRLGLGEAVLPSDYAAVPRAFA